MWFRNELSSLAEVSLYLSRKLCKLRYFRVSTFCYFHKMYLPCVLFHDAVNADNYTTSNNGVNDEKGQGYDIIEAGCYPDIWLEGLTQTTEKSVRTGVYKCSISLGVCLTVIGARRVMWSQFHAADLNLLSATVQNTVARATGGPGFANFWVRCPMTGTERDSK